MATELSVDAMTCEGCVDIVESAIENVDGVDNVQANRDDDVVVVEGDAETESLVEAVEMAGYEASEA